MNLLLDCSHELKIRRVPSPNYFPLGEYLSPFPCVLVDAIEGRFVVEFGNIFEVQHPSTMHGFLVVPQRRKPLDFVYIDRKDSYCGKGVRFLKGMSSVFS